MKINLTTKILLGLLLGVIAGLVLGKSGLPFAKTWIAPLGSIFMNLIKMIIVPLVFSSLLVGIAGLENIAKVGRIGSKSLVLYLGTTAFAIILGIILGVIFTPGAGLAMPGAGVKATAKAAPHLMKIFVDIFPTNVFISMTKANMLQIIAISVFAGLGLVSIGEKGATVMSFFTGVTEICYKVVGFIMEFAPIGVFGLICPVVAANGPSVLLPLSKVIAAVYIGCFLHGVLVYGSMLKLIGNLNVKEFFKGVLPAQLIAFTSCSSNGTLPVSMECAQKLGVSKEVSSFVLPLGATINMDGTAIYQGVCALFVAQIYGVDLTFAQYATIIVTGTLASIGTAGVPGAGYIMLTMILTAIGLPLEGSVLIAGIDRILDMPRTTINITGDIMVSALVDQSERKAQA